MTATVHRVAGMAVLAAILGACGPTAPTVGWTTGPARPSSSAGALPGTSRFEGQEVSFDYPATWRAATFPVMSSFSDLIVDLSTEPMSDPCDRLPGSVICPRSAVAGLPPGAILVDWTHWGFASWTFDPTRGRSITVGGRPATIEDLAPSEPCQSIGGERELVVTIPDPDARWNWMEVRACLHGPGLVGLRTQVETMLSTVRWTP